MKIQSNAQPGSLLAVIDCTQEHPPQEYFAHGEVKVVETRAGRYREAEAVPLSRFGYRFSIQKIGQPHLAIIYYPDDKRRFMCIMDGTCYDLTTGVFTDWAQPLSGKMLEARQIFWPRWNDCSIVFMTWGEGEPAAASRIEIYQLDDLPPLSVPSDPGDGSRRELGIQYEDPCGTGTSEGAQNREEWLERVIAYARHTGQKLFVYPLAWYHGPQFPSKKEPSDTISGVVARDRTQYCRWTTHPEDWYARMLQRFEEEGLEWQASLTLLRLGSLMEKMNTDLEAIKAGADTINNMLWNDLVRKGTGDWTVTWNARFLARIADKLEPGIARQLFSSQPGERDFPPPFPYGERHTIGNHPGPIFNPLHPIVQEAVLELVKEIVDRYGQYSAFKGISFNIYASSMLWFGCLHAGYDDYTVRLFETETGITVPVDRSAPDRFSQRYHYLTASCRRAWIAWRCRKIREFFRRMRDEIVARRPDLRMTITLWQETVVPHLLAPLASPYQPALGAVAAAHQLHARSNTVQLCREGGIDLELLRDEPGIEVDLEMGNPRDRGGHGPNPTEGVNMPLEQTCMYRDHDFLDQQSLDAMAAHRSPGVFIFNCWVEAWGKHVWSRCDPDDPNKAELAWLDGKPAEGFVKVNSEYPKDGFWWESQLRITPPFPAGAHFLEPYAHAVAELDACRITRGGLFLDKAHTELIQRFARAYRALPKRKFETVGTSTDPVAVRKLACDSRRYFYLINREWYPVEVKLAFDRSPASVIDLATDQSVAASERWHLELGSYELRSLATDRAVDLVGFVATPPAEIARSLIEEGEKSLCQLDELRAQGKFIPGMESIEHGIRSAIEQGRLAWLRRALTGYHVRKCRELLTREGAS